MSIRTDKIARTYQKEISNLINLELKDPSLGFVTITKVEVKGDLSQVTVFVSILGADKDKKDSIAALTRAKGFIRKEMAARVNMKFSPELVFELDISGEKLEDVLHLIEAMEKGRQIQAEEKGKQSGK